MDDDEATLPPEVEEVLKDYWRFNDQLVDAQTVVIDLAKKSGHIHPMARDMPQRHDEAWISTLPPEAKVALRRANEMKELWMHKFVAVVCALRRAGLEVAEIAERLQFQYGEHGAIAAVLDVQMAAEDLRRKLGNESGPPAEKD